MREPSAIQQPSRLRRSTPERDKCPYETQGSASRRRERRWIKAFAPLPARGSASAQRLHAAVQPAPESLRVASRSFIATPAHTTPQLHQIPYLPDWEFDAVRARGAGWFWWACPEAAEHAGARVVRGNVAGCASDMCTRGRPRAGRRAVVTRPGSRRLGGLVRGLAGDQDQALELGYQKAVLVEDAGV